MPEPKKSILFEWTSCFVDWLFSREEEPVTHPEPGPTPEERARIPFGMLPDEEPRTYGEKVQIQAVVEQIRAAEQAARRKALEDLATDESFGFSPTVRDRLRARAEEENDA